jgi:pimeloyl-ACP methyl ester carboxylesterase
MSHALRGLIAFFFLAALLPAEPAQAAPAGDLPEGCTPGELNGSVIAVCLPPEGLWNGDVVVYAHGYVGPNVTAPSIPLEQLGLPDGTNLPALVTGLGYAFAVTSYPVNGLVVGGGKNVGVQAVDDLAAYLAGALQPGRMYLAGVSEGGLVATLALEEANTPFAAGLATCGPIGDFRAQVNYLGDFRVVFDAFFPSVLPGSPVAIPPELINDEVWKGQVAPLVAATVTNPANSNATRQLFNVTRAAYNPAVPTSIAESAVAILWYNIFGTNDANDKLGGNPFENRSRWYFGSQNDWQLNRKVGRYAASPAAITTLNKTLQTTGKLARPLITLHTTSDPVVPYWHELLYTSKVLSAGRWGQRINIPILRYGHCAFSQTEVVAGFGLMVLRATGGKLPFSAVQAVLPDAASQADYQAIEDQYIEVPPPPTQNYLPLIQQ